MAEVLKRKTNGPYLGSKRHLATQDPIRNEKIRQSKLGVKNPNWVGDKVSYEGLHGWVKYRLKKPLVCHSCLKQPTYRNGLDLANISQKYKRDLSDWEWLCRKCHMTKDGRLQKSLKNFAVFRRKGKPVRRSSSRFLGVTFMRNFNKWRAQLEHKKVLHVCGYYKTAKAAALAIDKKRIEVFGKKTNLNFLNFPNKFKKILR